MSEIQYCSACKGAKTIMGMGCMRKKCTECNGVGYIETNGKEVKLEINPSDLKNKILSNAKSEAKKKKAGRPRKNDIQEK